MPYVSGSPEQLPSDSTGNVVRTHSYVAGVFTETVTYTVNKLKPGGQDGTLVYVNGKLKTRSDQS